MLFLLRKSENEMRVWLKIKDFISGPLSKCQVRTISSNSEYYFVENKENYPHVSISSTPVIEICSQKSISSPGSSVTMQSVTPLPELQKNIRKDIRSIYNYSSSQKKKLPELKQYHLEYRIIQKILRANKSKTKSLKKIKKYPIWDKSYLI
ncbi:hypothetical protein JTB14_026166 [Gonioctena quinquepunctata]|nr:hypothetical protein JTB14_026166 [Gonioctena quinquepunctata]